MKTCVLDVRVDLCLGTYRCTFLEESFFLSSLSLHKLRRSISLNTYSADEGIDA